LLFDDFAPASRFSGTSGRGVRTPVRKALLAGASTKETYGRVFDFERMMDTLGAIVIGKRRMPPPLPMTAAETG
jgi:hypothetical protein